MDQALLANPLSPCASLGERRAEEHRLNASSAKRKMQNFGYLIIGSTILVGFALASRFYEGRWVSPAMLFAFAFFSSTFLYGYSIELQPYLYTDIAFENLEIAYSLSTQSFLSLLIGYIGYWKTLGARQRYFSGKVSLDPFLSPNAVLALARLTIFLCGVLVFYTSYTGAFSSVRGANAYVTEADVGILFRIGFVVTHVVPSFILATVVGVQDITGQTRRKVVFLMWASFGIIFLVTLLSFNRQLAVGTGILLLLVTHYRIRPLKLKHLISVFFLVFLLQVIRGFRALKIPLADFNIPMILDYFSGQADSTSMAATIQGIFTGIGGFNVFTNVINLVPNLEGFKYGSTYLMSLVGLLTPRVLGLSSYGDFTLSLWYRDLHSPGTTSHGFDFSMLAEAYINFGYMMPFVFGIIGFLLAILSRTLCKTRSPRLLFVSSIGILSLTLSLRSDSNVLFKSVFYETIPILLFMEFLRRFYPATRNFHSGTTNAKRS